MKIEEINDWLQVLGLVAVTISLVFVGFELKQSRDIAMAEIYQERTALAFQLITNSANEQYFSGIKKIHGGEKPTDYEKFQINADYVRWLTYWENLHFQYELGLLTQEQWDASVNGMRVIAGEQLFIEVWNRGQNQWRASYAKVIDELIKKSNSGDSTSIE